MKLEYALKMKDVFCLAYIHKTNRWLMLFVIEAFPEMRNNFNHAHRITGRTSEPFFHWKKRRQGTVIVVIELSI